MAQAGAGRDVTLQRLRRGRAVGPNLTFVTPSEKSHISLDAKGMYSLFMTGVGVVVVAVESAVLRHCSLYSPPGHGAVTSVV